MYSRYCRVGLLLVLTLGLAGSLSASQPPPRVRISFEKPPKVPVGKHAQVRLVIEALDNVDGVDVNIELPRGATLHSGSLEHRLVALWKGGRVVLPIKVSADGSFVTERISVDVETEKDNVRKVDRADLYLVSYQGIVEFLTQQEISDHTSRVWRAPHIIDGVDTATVTPISYQEHFIQLDPDLENVEDSIKYIFEDGKPFVKVIRGGVDPTTGNTLGKVTQNTSVTVTVYGTVRFQDSNSGMHDFANSTVYIYDDDEDRAEYLGSTTTDSYGYFNKTVTGDDPWPDTEIEVFLVIKTSNSKVKVYTVNGSGINSFVIDPAVTTSGGSINWGTINLTWGDYQACSIFHWMNESWNFSASRGYDPGLIKANYPDSRGSSFSLSDNRIYIAGGDWIWSDEDVTRHEYGHNLMYNAQNQWWPPYPAGETHNVLGLNSEGFAWAEGWATAFAQFVDTDGWYNGNMVMYIELPDQDPNWSYATSHRNQVRVAAAVSDLYDSNQDGDDYAIIDYSKIISAIRNNNNDHLIEFWNTLMGSLSQSDKHYGSRALRYNTINVDEEPIIAVTIYGPHEMAYGDVETFTTTVIGGSGNISYQWYKRDWGTGSWEELGTAWDQDVTMYWEDFELRVEVLRSGLTGEDLHYVMYYDPREPMYKSVVSGIPDSYELSQNYPNPFNPSTVIEYSLPEASRVSFVIYDLMGHKVSGGGEPVERGPGFWHFVWDGKNIRGKVVPAGVYFYVLRANSLESEREFVQVRKMLLLK